MNHSFSPDTLRKTGPFADAAMGYLTRWPRELAAGFSPGPQGLVRLSERLEAHLDRPTLDDESERLEIEGAGALLGLLLVQQLGDGQHRSRQGAHLLRLGQRGDVDLFAAIERTLDSPSVCAQLREEVQTAEAEARDAGPLSRVVRALAERLATCTEPRAIRDQFGHDVTLSSGETLDLGEVVRTTRDQNADGVHSAVRKLIEMLAGVEPQELDWLHARSRLIPRPLQQDALIEFQKARSLELWQEPLGNGLCTALLIEGDDRARYLEAHEARSWGVPDRVLRERALQNLARHADEVRMGRWQTETGPVVVSRGRDARDAARLLLPGMPAVLKEALGGDPAVAIPNRDTLLACRASDGEARAQLRNRAALAMKQSPQALSAGLFVFGPRGPRPLAAG